MPVEDVSVVADMPRPWAMKSPHFCEDVEAADCSVAWFDVLDVEIVDSEEGSVDRVVPLVNEAF